MHLLGPGVGFRFQVMDYIPLCFVAVFVYTVNYVVKKASRDRIHLIDRIQIHGQMLEKICGKKYYIHRQNATRSLATGQCAIIVQSNSRVVVVRLPLFALLPLSCLFQNSIPCGHLPTSCLGRARSPLGRAGSSRRCRRPSRCSCGFEIARHGQQCR